MSGSRESEAALEAARAAAQSLRAVNHLTQPGRARLDAPALYDLLAEITLLAGRLPQVLHQVDTSLQRLVPDDVVAVDGAFAGDPSALAAAVHDHLAVAAAAARQVANAADRAQQALSSAATPDHPAAAWDPCPPLPRRDPPPAGPARRAHGRPGPAI